MSIFGVDLGPLDDATGWITDQFGNLVHKASGQNDYRATGYVPDASQFANPTPTEMTAQLRETALNPADLREAPQAVAPTVTPVADATRSVVTPVADAGRSTFDTSVLAPGLGVTAAGLAQSGQDRGIQTGNLARLTRAAEGTVPSAAERQLGMSLDRVQRQNLAAAASARGTAANRVEAQRNAIDANTDAGLQASGQAAALRAGEQATAREQLTGAIGGMRQQDLGGAGIGVGLTGIGAQVGTAQLGSDTGTNLANLTKNTNLATAQLSSDTQTQLANLGKNLNLSTAQLGANLQTNIANMGAVLNSRQLDDNQKANALAAALGIDTRTQQGQTALETLRANIAQWTQAINANITSGNATNAQQFSGAVIGGGAALGGAGIAAGGGGAPAAGAAPINIGSSPLYQPGSYSGAVSFG